MFHIVKQQKTVKSNVSAQYLIIDSNSTLLGANSHVVTPNRNKGNLNGSMADEAAEIQEWMHLLVSGFVKLWISKYFY